jgi:hypothetical protein
MYAVKKLSNKSFAVTNLEDEPKTYNVTKSTKGYYSCDCMGYARQKDKTQHKHCLMVKALEELEDFDSMVLDEDWKVVSAYSMKEALDQLESFMDEVIKG